MTAYLDEYSDYEIWMGLMESLDQAFLARQGLGGTGPREWGDRFFTALDHLYPSWPEQGRDVYLAAAQLIYHFAHSRAETFTCRLMDQKPESLVRLAVMLLRNNLLPVHF